MAKITALSVSCPSTRTHTGIKTANHKRHVVCYALGSSDKNKKPPISLDRAADDFAKGVAAGSDEDDIVAQQISGGDPTKLTPVQEKYKNQVKAKLAERAEELKREREARAVKFTAGKKAYATGQYPAAVALLESALNEEGPFSQLGGEIQLWLAEAYAACGRDEECIATYKNVEETHPSPPLRRRAYELRYIMEAPKLEIGEDEKVKVPVLSDLEPNRGRKSGPLPAKISKPKRELSWDEKYWENWQPPKYMSNKYVWAASAIVAVGLIWYSIRLTH